MGVPPESLQELLKEMSPNGKSPCVPPRGPQAEVEVPRGENTQRPSRRCAS